MKRKTPLAILAAVGLCSTLFLQSCNLNTDNNNKIYKETWSSLAEHHTPNWLLGMKFGIYSHWGPNSIRVNQEKANQDENLVNLLEKSFIAIRPGCKVGLKECKNPILNIILICFGLILVLEQV